MAEEGQDQAHLDDTEPGQETTLDRLVAEVNSEPDKEETTVDPNDPDAVEEAEARKALQAEEDAAKAAAEPDKGKASAEAGAEGDGKDAAKADQQQPDKGKPMIPKGRLDEVASQRDQARAEAAYWKGVADARAAAGGKAEEEPAKPTPQQQIAELQTQQDALAKKVDDGEMLMSDFLKESRKIEADIGAIRDEMRKPAEAKPNRPPGDLYLDQKTEELEQAHPYMPLLDDDDTAFLVRKAVTALDAEGIKLPKGELQPRELLVLRTKVAELSDTYGPVLTGKTIQKPNPASNGRPAMSKEALQRAAKLDAAAEAPPDLTAAGRSTAPTSGPTEDQIANMTDEQIEALPQATRDRIMGRLPA